MSTTGITPLKFTGVSTFSTDFQTIIDRAVKIASLPITQMQNQQADLLSKKTLLSGLNGNLQSVYSAMSDLATLGSTKAVSATSSDTTKVSVQLTGSPTPTSYTITDITSVAKRAGETMVTGYADTDTTQVDSDGKLQLVLGSEKTDIDLTDYGNNLAGLRDAINASGANVSASIINTGDASTPYYLSITANSTGATKLELRSTADNASTNMLTNVNQGSDAFFKLNGLTITKSDNTVSDVVPGVTFTLLNTTETGQGAVLNITSNRGTLATKLSALVSAYNSAMSSVNGQIGKTAGLLSGDSIISSAGQALRKVSSYRAESGTVKSLADLGVTLDRNGVMSFDSSKFYSLPSSTIDAAFSFLGTSTTGFGAMGAGIDALSNSFTGTIAAQQSQYDAADARMTKNINQISDRINLMQTNLEAKLQIADTLLSQLQSQQTMLKNLIDAQNKNSSSNQ